MSHVCLIGCDLCCLFVDWCGACVVLSLLVVAAVVGKELLNLLFFDQFMDLLLLVFKLRSDAVGYSAI